MAIALKLKILRINLRINSKIIIEYLTNNYITRKDNKAKSHKEAAICMFCGSPKQITKEHVVPKWIFEGSSKKDFITNINGIKQTYIKTTIPTCSSCNNDLLSSLEKYISNAFANIDLEKEFFNDEEIQNIIRWLETIEYKFQVLNISRKFLTSKQAGFIPYLADFPISILRLNKEYSPAKVISEIRASQRRITVKNKKESKNSLVIFKTKNKVFHFFHNMNDFIFFEIPQFKIAVFYFFNKNFISNKEAYNEAMKLITRFY